MTERITQVYLIRLGDTEYFKVGVTTDINGRLSSLQTATPFDLHLIIAADHPNAFAVEKDMHAALKEYHVRNEWFQCSQESIVRIFCVVDAMAVIDRELADVNVPEIEKQSSKNQKIESMLRQGFGYRQIGRELGVSHQTISQVSVALRSMGEETIESSDDLEYSPA